MAKVIILGPAYPLRGGISAFNHRLAQEFLAEGHDCSIYSFSLQYPNFLFPGKTQFSTAPAPENLIIHTEVNSINPLNWWRVGRELKKQKPDLLIVRYWLPFMGASLGTILRVVKRNKHTKIVCIADNIIPHEKRIGDNLLTRYFLKPCDAVMVMSEQVLQDLKSIAPQKKHSLSPHPLYDSFGEKLSKVEARKNLGWPLNQKIILFFGFIRKYKGLDLLLHAMANSSIKEQGIKLVIAGEFYDDEQSYKELAKELGIQDSLIWHSSFIADDQVKNFFCASDVVVQPYKHATQSGVTPLAYHFERPMIVTHAGGLPDLVPHKEVGLVCEPNSDAIAESILEYYKMGETHFAPYILENKKKYSWKPFVDAILQLVKRS